MNFGRDGDLLNITGRDQNSSKVLIPVSNCRFFASVGGRGGIFEFSEKSSGDCRVLFNSNTKSQIICANLIHMSFGVHRFITVLLPDPNH